MKHYSYVVARDYGFAPNPFGLHCTLATCKPEIRNYSEEGSWIFGLSPKDRDQGNRLVFAMKVTEIMTYDEYWQSSEFQYKKPILNGSLKQMYGDNIYHKDKLGKWIQSDSHHSLENGEVNLKNLNRDTKSEFVLISNCFYYFGMKCIELPTDIKKGLLIRRGRKLISDQLMQELVKWLEMNYKKGLSGIPMWFNELQRYDGVS